MELSVRKIKPVGIAATTSDVAEAPILNRLLLLCRPSCQWPARSIAPTVFTPSVGASRAPGQAAAPGQTAEGSGELYPASAGYESPSRYQRTGPQTMHQPSQPSCHEPRGTDLFRCVRRLHARPGQTLQKLRNGLQPRAPAAESGTHRTLNKPICPPQPRPSFPCEALDDGFAQFTAKHWLWLFP